ncbi:MAG: hypothetical protein HY878_04905 [Deltaproteobacteria bacterium]|nr:hypothetical protein [Deltaproteobacteria bacterium]
MIDTRTDSASLTGGYELTPDRTIKMTYTYRNFFFDTAGNGNNSENHSIQLALAERLSPTLSLDLSGGVTYGIDDDRYDWIARAGITKTFQGSSLNLGYSRDVTNTSGLTDETSISDRLSMGWNFTLTRSFNLTISGNLSKNRSEPSARVDTTSYNASIGGEWQPYSWMRVGVGYSRFQQWADGPLGEDLSRDQVFVNITVTPEGWRF